MTPAEVEHECEELARELEKEPVRRSPEKLLYHYTDAVGLDGILRSGCIRATHYQYLNDRRELVEGKELVHRATDEVADEHRSAVGWLAKHFREVFAMPHIDEVTRDTFVASFSEQDDDLGQWRAYGAQGGGYAIGIEFRPRPEEKPEPDLPFGAMLVPCQYRHDEAKERMKAELVEVLTATARRMAKCGTDEGALNRVRARGMVMALRRVGEHWFQIKNPAFEAEAEWRYLVVPAPKRRQEAIKVRASVARGLIPYLEIPLNGDAPPPLQVERIVVGPTHHPNQGKMAAVLLLESLGYDRAHADNIVVESKIPFRS